ncbi:MAG: hypothetical protein M3Q10_03285 [Chloroflexota bacterium]|nr:hypothetical protein [Chloroflexota bacterium]
MRTVMRHVIAAHRNTAVVLPTRYGKSDVVRVASTGLQRDGYVTATLALSPNELLRDQFLKVEKWSEALARYGIPGGVRFRRLSRIDTQYCPNGETFLSSTIQLVQRNVDLVAGWVESVAHERGAPVLVVIDEAHTGSEDNSWGQAALTLQDAGAHVLLLTATAMRSDGRVIPGFDCDVLDEQDVRYYTVRRDAERQRRYVDTYAGTSRLVRLKAHHETTFKEAWDEHPSPLCKLSRVPYDVAMTEVLGDDSTPGVVLSHLGRSKVRGVLGRVVRDPTVAREGVRRLVEGLRHYRASDPRTGAIVFCGNDTDPVGRTNEHAAMIAGEIGRQASGLAVVVATASDGNEGAGKIQRFADGVEGDVLVVKQMAGLGLDAPRLKVCLDLSTIRTPAAFVQRIMRIATPFGGIRHGLYITPDDLIGRDLFEDFVAGEGGAMTTKDGELVETRLVEERDAEERSRYEVNGTNASAFQDTLGGQADADKQIVVDEVMRRLPELASLMSYPEVARRFDGVRLESVPTAVPASAGDPAWAECAVVDTSSQIETQRRAIGATVKDVVRARLAGSYDRSRYAEEIRSVWVSLYGKVGVAVGTELGLISDLSTLQRLFAEAEGMLAAEYGHVEAD